MIFNGATEKAIQLIRKKLNDCLLKSGGVLTGNLSLGSNAEKIKRVMGFYNSEREVSEILGTDGTFYAFDHTNSKTIYGSTKDGANTFYGEASECLSKNSGGTVNGFTKINSEDAVPFSIQNKKGDTVYSAYSNANELLGMLGFKEKDKPVMYTADWTKQCELFHAGNTLKYGSYVGTDNSQVIYLDTENFIAAIITGSNKCTAILLNQGCIWVERGVSGVNFLSFPDAFVAPSEKAIHLYTTCKALNATDVTYTYSLIV